MANIGGMSMRKAPNVPTKQNYTKKNQTANYWLFFKRRKTGLVGKSGTVNTYT